MRVLDLFCGKKGFSQAFRDRGDEITTIDINKDFHPDICADLRRFILRDSSARWDVVLASPPCTEFTRSILPWYDQGPPSMELLNKTVKIITQIKPLFWIIENVKGAVKWFAPTLGSPRQRAGSRYLWGNFPMFLVLHKECYGKAQAKRYKNYAEMKSIIPYAISKGLRDAIERRL